jgi:hypothetical protein
MHIVRRLSPEVSDADWRALGELTRHSPGLALEWHARGALAMMEKIEALMASFPAIPASRLQSFCDAIVTGKQTHAQWRLFTELFQAFLARHAARAPFWVEAWERAGEEFSLAERLHLDYKTVLLSYFESLIREGAQHSHAG